MTAATATEALRRSTSKWIRQKSSIPAILMVLLFTSAAVPKVYLWIARFHLKKRYFRAPKGRRQEFDDGDDHHNDQLLLPILNLGDRSVPRFGFMSRVRTQASPDSVVLPTTLKLGTTSIPFSKLVIDNVPQLRNGASTLMNPLLFNGHIQTMYAALPFEGANKVYYGRRCIYWKEDGALVTADYMIEPPKSEAEWNQKLEYCPLDLELDDVKFPRPARLRYLTPDEVASKNRKQQQQQQQPQPQQPERPLLVLLHGLSGGSHESYIRSTVAEISKQAQYGGADGTGFECVVLNSRGCASTPITTPQLFCAVWTDDIRRFIRLLRSEEDPNNRRRIYLVGYSLGASILANYLGQQGFETSEPESRVDAAMVVANPWDLLHSNQFLNDSTLGHYVYSPVMSKSLVRLVDRHQPGLSKGAPGIFGTRNNSDDGNVDARTKSLNIKSIHDFDQYFTAPYFGFHSAKDYYRNASSVIRLMNIRTPTLILNALDDPIVHKDCIPYREAFLNPYLVLSTTSLGGHIGWFTARGAGGRNEGHRWFPEVIARYFGAYDKIVDHSKAVPRVNPDVPKRLMIGDRLVMPSLV